MAELHSFEPRTPLVTPSATLHPSMAPRLLDASPPWPACPQCGSEDVAPVAVEVGALGQFLTIRCDGCGHEQELRVEPSDDDVPIGL